ncbi:hypothetical protein [Ramlibacter sp.]|uniref:YncE family protein n=1 Tax=Ramlibacter sp. TaxID=1917967 RepID=UPI00179544D0|nr:hypothetical protein [Ramlibacter sp.]MBA2673530.1 hypothetical protein [Ramlibacter sp.]
MFVIDVEARQVRRVLDLAPHRGPHAMAEDPDGKLWITCDDSSEVLVVDPATGAVAGVIDMDCHGGHFMCMSLDGSTAYVSNKDTAHLSVIDFASRTIRARVPLAEGGEGLCLSPDGTRLLVMSHMGSPLPNEGRPEHLSVYVIDTATLKLIQQVPLPTLPGIALDADKESRVAISPDGQWVLVSAFRWNSFVVLNAGTLAIEKTLLVEAEPMNFAWRSDDPAAAYVANHGAGCVSRLSLETLTVSDRWPSTPPGCKGRPEDLMFVRSR